MNAPHTTLQARPKYPAIATYEYLQRMAERHKKGASSMRIEELDKKIIEYQKKIGELTEAFDACPTYEVKPKLTYGEVMLRWAKETLEHLEKQKISASSEKMLELEIEIAEYQEKIDRWEQENDNN